jgi:hypothetical protein
MRGNSQLAKRHYVPYSSTQHHNTMKREDTASANEDQNSRRQEDDSIVVTRTEGAPAAGKHEGAHGIDNVGQRV